MNVSRATNRISSASRSNDFDADALSLARDEILARRLDSLGFDGVFLDRSATGIGKTRACMKAIREWLPGKSLVATRTHREADELVYEYRHRWRLPVVPYPRRTTQPLTFPIPCPFCGINPPGPPNPNCVHCHGSGRIKRFLSCWNMDADIAQQAGLSVSAAICPKCKFKEQCDQIGYRRLVREATEAQIAVATHARLEHRCFIDVCEGRDYISIQENAIPMLRPVETIRFETLCQADPILTLLFNDPRRLRYWDELDRLGRSQIEAFLRQMAKVSSLIIEAAQSFRDPFVVIPLPEGIKKPARVEQILWEAACETKLTPGEPLYAILRAATAGDLHSLILFRPDAYGRWKTGRKDRRSSNLSGGQELELLAYFRNERPRPATVWFSDASMDQYRLEAILGEPLSDVIETSHLRPQKRILQIAEDLTQKTSKFNGRKARKLVREALAIFPDRTRSGVLCPLKLKGCLDQLEPIFNSRIWKIEHFRGGADRGSNQWHQECDLLIVLGTPRIPPREVAKELIRLGEYEAARRDGRWGEYKWRATNEDGSKFDVVGLGYGDERWQAMHQALVREELRQAAGRARAHLPQGIDVIVFSNEELGYPTAPPSLLTGLTDSVGRTIEQLCGVYSNKAQLGFTPHSCHNDFGDRPKRRRRSPLSVRNGELAGRLGIGKDAINECLRTAEKAKIIERVGERGWKPTEAWSPNSVCVYGRGIAGSREPDGFVSGLAAAES